ncbi:MAG: hypothetical protein IPK59_08190 [Rhodospirillaceae bacterium]|nr:hypothetical protein [Rhodospirillaceae bacterium]
MANVKPESGAPELVFSIGERRSGERATLDNRFRYRTEAVVVASGVDPAIDLNHSDLNLSWRDWTVVKLRDCLGGPTYEFGYVDLLPVTTSTLLHSEEIAVEAVGYVARNSQKVVDRDCEILGVFNSAGWQSNCTLKKGLSGGPIFNKTVGSERPRMIAIAHKAANVFHVSSSAVHQNSSAYYRRLSTVLPVAAFYNQIRKIVEEDRNSEREMPVLTDPERHDLTHDVIPVLESKIADNGESAARLYQLAVLKTTADYGPAGFRPETVLAAILLLTRAVELDPDFSPAIVFRAILTFYAENRAIQGGVSPDRKVLEKVLLDFELARPENSQDEQVETGILRAALALGYCEKARKAMESLAANFPDLGVEHVFQEEVKACKSS